MISALLGTQSVITPRTFPVDGKVWVQRPHRLDEIDVYWTPTDSYPSGYNVYRSQNPAGPLNQMTKLNTTLLTIPFYRDQTVDAERLPFYYYVVAEVMGSGDETPLNDPVSLQSFYWHNARREQTITMPRIYAEFIDRKYFMLRNNAEVVDLLLRKVAGERCPSYNPEYEQSIPCPLCYGTGWIGGYDIVRDVMVRIVPSTQNYLMTPYGLAMKIQPQAWLADWPLLRNGDTIVRADATRYVIENLALTMHQGVITEQSFQLAYVDPSFPVYDVEVGDVPVGEQPEPAVCPY